MPYHYGTKKKKKTKKKGKKKKGMSYGGKMK